jgi:hypothetical protein
LLRFILLLVAVHRPLLYRIAAPVDELTAGYQYMTQALVGVRGLQRCSRRGNASAWESIRLPLTT